jgi:hypothetical protein
MRPSHGMTLKMHRQYRDYFDFCVWLDIPEIGYHERALIRCGSAVGRQVLEHVARALELLMPVQCSG